MAHCIVAVAAVAVVAEWVVFAVFVVVFVDRILVHSPERKT